MTRIKPSGGDSALGIVASNGYSIDGTVICYCHWENRMARRKTCRTATLSL